MAHAKSVEISTIEVNLWYTIIVIVEINSVLSGDCGYSSVRMIKIEWKVNKLAQSGIGNMFSFSLQKISLSLRLKKKPKIKLYMHGFFAWAICLRVCSYHNLNIQLPNRMDTNYNKYLHGFLQALNIYLGDSIGLAKNSIGKLRLHWTRLVMQLAGMQQRTQLDKCNAHKKNPLKFQCNLYLLPKSNYRFRDTKQHHFFVHSTSNVNCVCYFVAGLVILNFRSPNCSSG